MSQVSIYNFFGSKDALLIDVMRTYIEKAIAEYGYYLTSSSPFPEIIQAVLVQEKEILRLVNLLLRQATQSDEFIGMLEEFQRERLIPYFLQLMEMGKQQGYLDPSVKVADLLWYFSMYQREMLRLSQERKDRRGGTDNLISDTMLIHFFFYGLIGRAGSP